MIKFIVTDLDGTLLNKEQKIPSKTKQYLKDLQKRGIKIILASGRNPKRMQEMIDDLELDTYCIAGNGYKIFHTTSNEEIIMDSFTKEETHYYFQKLKQYGEEILAFSPTTLYSYIPEKIKEEKLDYLQEHKLPKPMNLIGGPYHIIYDHSKAYEKIELQSDFKQEVYKICVKGKKATLLKIQKAMKDEKCQCVITSDNWLELLPLNNSKGNALKQVAKKMNFKLEEVIAFGDGENDLSMLELVGKAYAMENGTDSLKQQIKKIAPSNDKEGVYQVLFEHFK